MPSRNILLATISKGDILFTIWNGKCIAIITILTIINLVNEVD